MAETERMVDLARKDRRVNEDHPVYLSAGRWAPKVNRVHRARGALRVHRVKRETVETSALSVHQEGPPGRREGLARWVPEALRAPSVHPGRQGRMGQWGHRGRWECCR